MNNYTEYCIQKESHGYSLWTCSYATGSKGDCLGFYRDKRACRRAWRKYQQRVS